MRSIKFLPAYLLAAGALLSACSSVPQNNSALEDAKRDFAMTQSNPTVARLASAELKQASDALDQANTAWTKKESLQKVDNLAYVAKQKTANAREVAKAKSAEESVADAKQQQDQIRLQQRTLEADKARMDADAAKTQAALAQNDAANAQRQKMDAEEHARQLQAQLNDLSAKKTERGLVITLGDVLFAVDKADLTPDGMMTVQKLGLILQQNPQRVVVVEGHTDSTGTAAHNQYLSERRANSVLIALMGMGIARDRVVTQGYGMKYPVASNDTAANRQLNRRVEIVLSEDDGKIAHR
ncbi:OmpA family protein [Undibacterium terreum]|uniref:Porin n=1 Tax=Undibacterium terreum TaxID=1224302 RepID=A0A916UQ21_9BURK|nr:OmpA family protein [Undibacterium terreum]GGC82649.1 porin [Undibacterium terreum]